MTAPATGTSGPVPASETDLLTVDGLVVGTRGSRLLGPVDLGVRARERVGVIGESGSGKTLTALAVTGLLPPGLRAAGSVTLHRDGGASQSLLGASERTLSRLRGRVVSMVFQEPMTALDPTMRTVDQVAEVLRVHRLAPDRGAAREAALRGLAEVGLDDPERIGASYPHQLSGGQRQRVGLAIALAGDPELLICDEPTSALDVTVQERVLRRIVEGARQHEAALLFISHDLAVVAQVCERVLVLHRGRLVEAGPVETVLSAPRHPYTQGLLAASDLTRTDGDGRLLTMDRFLPAAEGERRWTGTRDDGWLAGVSA